MDWQLIIELDGKKDIRDGFFYYKEQAGVDIALRFRERVRAGMRLVLEAPERWPAKPTLGRRLSERKRSGNRLLSSCRESASQKMRRPGSA